MKQNEWRNQELIDYIIYLYNLFHKIDYDIRRPFSQMLWVLYEKQHQPIIFHKLESENITFEQIKDFILAILSKDDFLNKCCGNEFINLVLTIDIIFFRDESPLKIAKADLTFKLKEFENLIYDSGQYNKKSYCHIFNVGSVSLPNEPIFGDYKLESLNPYDLPILIGEKSLFSSLHPFELSPLFLTKEDSLPCNNEEINSHILNIWQGANIYIQVLKYIKDSPICIDYVTLLYSPFWLNSVRREGIFLFGRPLRSKSNNKYDIDKDTQKLALKWLTFLSSDGIKKRFDMDYMQTEKIKIPELRKTISTAGTHYENYHNREEVSDKFILLIFALESLFSPITESTYRISMHAATLLEDYGPNRNIIFKFMSKMLKNRADLVHGRKLFNELDISENDIERFASYIRQSMLSIIAIYLRGENSRGNLLKRLDNLVLGAENYPSFNEETNLEKFIDVVLTKG